MSNIDQEFVEYLVKSLVSKPEAVIVERSIDEKGVLLQLTVDPEDLGRVIGKRGNTAQSIRTLLRALGTKNDARYNLKIVDNGEDKPRNNDRSDNTSSPSSGSSDDNSSSSAVSPWAHLSSSNDDSDDSNDDDSNSETDDSGDEVVENSVVEKTKKELADLDDLDI